MATDPEHEQEHARMYGRLVAKAWNDEAFRQRLLAEPAVVLAEEGFEILPGRQVRVVEDTAEVSHLVLPPKPAEGDLSEEQLAQVSAGLTCSNICWCEQTTRHCYCNESGYCHQWSA
jgi:hypothetical protein